MVFETFINNYKFNKKK